MIKTGIALPGSPGEYIDWLDIMMEPSGVNAVRAGIFAAEEFIPKPDELERNSKKLQRDDELAEIKNAYPLPQLDGVWLRYVYLGDRVMLG